MKLNRNAFTLIELLVVISVIALLLSVVLPALNKAKQKSRMVVSAAQFRQQGISFISYSTDHKRYPPGVVRGYWPFGGLGNNEDNHPASTKPWFPAGQAALYVNGYLDDPRFFFSAAASKGTSGDTRPLSYELDWVRYWNPDQPGWQVGKNGPYSGYPYWVSYQSGMAVYDTKLAKVIAESHTSRSDRIIATDMITTNDPKGGPGGDYATVVDDPVFANHTPGGKLRGGYILYNDGSVQWVSMNELLSDGKDPSGMPHRLRLRIPVKIGVGGSKVVNFWF